MEVKKKSIFLVIREKIHYLYADSHGQVEKEKMMKEKGELLE